MINPTDEVTIKPLTQFEINRQRWSLLSPDDVTKIPISASPQASLSKTQKGELNIKKKIEGKTINLHSIKGAEEEANIWFSNLDLKHITTLIVYGIGLGYFYDAAKKWLREDPSRYLIFIEDDPDVLFYFFETVRASELLHDKQVRLHYFDKLDFNEKLLLSLASTFCLKEFEISTLPSYEEIFPGITSYLKGRICFWSELQRGFAAESLSFGNDFFLNFYQNLLHLPDSYVANSLFGKFKGIPAIICGAGPSLDKNLDLLTTLGDRALIFSGGTAMNAVNGKGFLPHFGLGIDPNKTQMTRLLSNKAFTVPYFYRSRMYHEAFRLIHGDPLYVNGSPGYNINEFFDSELGLEGKVIEEGMNVINFNLSLAHALGCDPIILVGVDLAYSNDHSYASGVTPHPSHTKRHDFRTKSFNDELLIKNDIHGKPVHTLWKWIGESMWFSWFASQNPNMFLVNATEGGIGFDGVPNMTLEEVANLLLTCSYDLDNLIHGEIQNGKLPPQLNVEKIVKLVEKFSKSLLKCQTYCQEIIDEYEKRAILLESDNDNSEPYPTQKEKSLKNLLSKEIGYTYLLKTPEDYYQKIKSAEWQQILYNSHTEDTRIIEIEKSRFFASQYQFLLDYLQNHLSIIEIFKQKADKIHSKEIGISTKTSQQKQVNEKINNNEEYSFDENIITIEDPELNISIKESFDPGPILEGSPNQYANGKILDYYDDRSLKMERYYCNGLLHGPSTYYSKSGKILAKTWYINGKKQGKAKKYYLTGQLHTLQRFHEGFLDGLQESFYQNGSIKTTVNYNKGQFNGEVWLYYPNGQLKRELHFQNGKRQGMDRLWTENGTLLIEGQYIDDLPMGTGRIWHENGILAQEITYDNLGEPVAIQRWDEYSNLRPEDSHEDFFDKVTKQTELLTSSLENMGFQLNRILPLLPTNTPSELKSDIEELQRSLLLLAQLNTSLTLESGLHKTDNLESLWKTPLSQSFIQKQIEESTQAMKISVEAMQNIIIQVKKLLKS